MTTPASSAEERKLADFCVVVYKTPGGAYRATVTGTQTGVTSEGFGGHPMFAVERAWHAASQKYNGLAAPRPAEEEGT